KIGGANKMSAGVIGAAVDIIIIRGAVRAVIGNAKDVDGPFIGKVDQPRQIGHSPTCAERHGNASLDVQAVAICDKGLADVEGIVNDEVVYMDGEFVDRDRSDGQRIR